MFEFKPFSKKQKVLRSWWDNAETNNYDGIVADGSIRSGKTVAMTFGFILWSAFNFTNKNFIVSGVSIGSVNRNVIIPLLNMLMSVGIDFKYLRSINQLEFCGNTYYIFGANNEASQDVLQGLTAAGWLADEVALQPESFIQQAIGRCSINGAKIWLNCNPESPNHYVYKELICKSEEKKLLHLHFTLEDNLTLSEETKKRYERMFSGVYYDRFILGKWVKAEGLIYDGFDKDKHVIDTPPEHIIKKWVSVDYGTQNATCFLLLGKDNKDKVYVLDEYYYSGRDERRQKTDMEYRLDLQDFIKGHRIENIIIDPSAASFITELNQAEMPTKKANNAVNDGIRKTASLLGAERLFIMSNCINLINEIQEYSWDNKALDERPLKENDHACDALRYGVIGIDKGASYMF